MHVRAKFTCYAITQSRSSVYNTVTGAYDPAVVETAKFQPVSSGSEENKKFFAATPCGQIEIGTVRQGM